MRTLKLKFRGIKLKKRFFRATRWILRRPKNPVAYLSLGPSSPPTSPPPPSREPRRTPVSRLLTWGRRLTSKTRCLCSAKPGSGYMPVDQDPQPAVVPKGHLAVYVGQKDAEFCRVLVPVIYFNHPLFSELLREAEEEFGFDHPGGITIPCGVSEFERVKTRIAAGGGGGGRGGARTALRRYY
ncbi:auxin-responsive protein SAUR36 [Syzygium oleosum]|uniref:auxin-responsive protein SAUR36 n=1 Tax=Syzygium oleosum TaxID=219896 RepID=UPI0024B8CE5A|nr:auxin-responsive protein SAUR36 [Syzygium oleosum]